MIADYTTEQTLSAIDAELADVARERERAERTAILSGQTFDGRRFDQWKAALDARRTAALDAIEYERQAPAREAEFLKADEALFSQWSELRAQIRKSVGTLNGLLAKSAGLADEISFTSFDETKAYPSLRKGSKFRTSNGGMLGVIRAEVIREELKRFAADLKESAAS